VLGGYEDWMMVYLWEGREKYRPLRRFRTMAYFNKEGKRVERADGKEAGDERAFVSPQAMVFLLV